MTEPIAGETLETVPDPLREREVAALEQIATGFRLLEGVVRIFTKHSLEDSGIPDEARRELQQLLGQP